MFRFAGALLLAACLLADVAPSLSSDVAESLATAGAKAAASAGAPGADAPEGTCSGVDSDDAAGGSAAQKPCGCAGLKRELMAVETEAVVSAEDMARPAVHLALVFAALDQAGTVPPTPLVRVEGGEFGMGTNKPEIPVDGEGPKRRVAVSAYRIEQMEVSNWQFAEFVRATNFTTESETFGWSFVFEGLVSAAENAKVTQSVAAAPWWIPVQQSSWHQPEGVDTSVLASHRMSHPVVHVSHNDAVAYCAWRKLRLPTEAEWEYASRGGQHQKKTPRLFPWGNKLTPKGTHRANIWQGDFPKHNTAEDGFKSTSPVDSFPDQNKLGLKNMIGNVWEWVR
jgi:sulfatase modifying factor 1